MNSDNYVGMVNALVESGNYEEALKLMESIVTKEEGSATAKFHLALLYETTEYYLDGYHRSLELLNEILQRGSCEVSSVILKAAIEDKMYGRVEPDTRGILLNTIANCEMSIIDAGIIYLLVARSYAADTIEYREYLEKSIESDNLGVRNHLFLYQISKMNADRKSLLAAAKRNVTVVNEIEYALSPLNFDQYKDEFIRGTKMSSAVYEIYFYELGI